MLRHTICLKFTSSSSSTGATRILLSQALAQSMRRAGAGKGKGGGGVEHLTTGAIPCAGIVDPDRMREFEDMQVGMYRDAVIKKRKENEEFLKLPREEQVRQFMLKKRKFDQDLVRKNGMDVQEEFKLFQKEMKRAQRQGSRSFWLPTIFCLFFTTIAPIYMISIWY